MLALVIGFYFAEKLTRPVRELAAGVSSSGYRHAPRRPDQLLTEAARGYLVVDAHHRLINAILDILVAEQVPRRSYSHRCPPCSVAQ